jgi:hypothetical protein
MKNFIMLTTAALVLGACSKDMPPEVISAKAFEYQTKQVETQISLMPAWFEKPPSDDSAVYAVGTAQTPDLQLSVDIAILSAKTTLADRVDSRLRSQLKMFKQRLGSTDFDSSVLNEFEQATTNLIADADVAGYTVKEQNIVQNGTQYRTYVLLEYKNELAMQMIKTRVASNEALMNKVSATKAWRALDEKVDAANEAKVNEIERITEALDS